LLFITKIQKKFLDADYNKASYACENYNGKLYLIYNTRNDAKLNKILFLSTLNIAVIHEDGKVTYENDAFDEYDTKLRALLKNYYFSHNLSIIKNNKLIIRIINNRNYIFVRITLD
jgi:hypothetical protein